MKELNEVDNARQKQMEFQEAREKAIQKLLNERADFIAQNDAQLAEFGYAQPKRGRPKKEAVA